MPGERSRDRVFAALPPPGDLSFNASGNLYATHALHAFAARCPPPLVDWAIRSFTSPGDTVLDPMMGSGTAVVEACLLGRTGRGAVIDPLARLVGKTKATPVDLDACDKALVEDDRRAGHHRRELSALGPPYLGSERAPPRR